MIRALAIVLLVGCGPYVGSAAEPLGWRWRTEPTVGPSSPELAPLVDHAIGAWGYGRAVASCADADVCVTRGQRSHAGRTPGGRCVAEIALGRTAVEQAPPEVLRVAEHELGHCYGLPHRNDPASVMHPNPHLGRGVTPEDRAILRRRQR